MPRILRNLVWCLIALSSAASADVPCSPTTPVPNQIRTALKHRTGGFQTVAMKTTTVEDMLSWPNPSQVSRANSAIDPREDQAFTISGDLWRIVMEANDCDFHLEIAPLGADSSADRVIVEIPQGPPFTPLRDQLQQALSDAHEGNIGLKSIALKHSIPITVSGLAFFDAFHFSQNNPKRGHNHGTKFVGTIWELHPVFALTIGTVQAPGTTLLASDQNGIPPVNEPEGGAFDFSISPAFLQSLETGKTIAFTTNLKLGAHSAVHPLKDDCEVHIAGFPAGDPPGSPSPFIVEPPNLCHFDPSGKETTDTSEWLTEFDGLKGKTCAVTGFPRIFTEHASTGGGPSNPNHVFEIHPATAIDCGGQTFDFSKFMTAISGMRTIAPSTTASCITQRQLFVRYDASSQQYLFRENGGRCGNFAIVEVARVYQQSVRDVGSGHSAIVRVSPDGQSTVTLKIYTLAGSEIDKWLTDQKANPSIDRVFIHGLFTYDYFAIQRTLHPRDQEWSQPSNWMPIRFPLAFVVYGQTDSAPWTEE